MANHETTTANRSEVTRELAQGLGWFSIGLGLAEVLAPQSLARALGMRGSEPLIRTYGLREIVTGIGILTSEKPAPWIKGRIAGDALDLATLATGMYGGNAKKGNVGIAIAAVAGVTALDVLCAERLAAEEQQHERRTLPKRDYSRRSGFPRPARAMRGAASDFEAPRDFRTPEAMRPYDYSKSGSPVAQH